MYELVYRRILENAAKTPDKAALIRPGMEEISYRQLRRHIIGARNYLIRAGVHPGEYVILSADRSFSFVYAYLAIHSIGAVAVPLDPHTPAPRLKYICDLLLPKAGFWISGDHGMTDITVFKESGEVLAKPLGARTSCPQILEKCGQNARVHCEAGSFARTSDNDDFGKDVPVDRNMPADVMFTSGTTALPKGVCLSHNNLAYAVNNINMFIGNCSDDVEINPMPLSHSFGLARLRCTLYAGATQVIIDGVMRHKALFETMDEYKATGIGMVGTAWAVLKRLSGDAIGRFKDQLCYMELGSAPIPAEEKAHLAALLPNTKVCMHYGLTEASRAVFQEFHERSDTLSTIGRPSPLAAVKIYSESGGCLPDGEIGEICVKGGMVAKGYLNVDNETAFWGDYFRTGDLGYRRSDGYIVLTGRLKEIINVGGNKVSLVEVEQALSVLPDIVDAACIGIPDTMFGEVVAAFVVSSYGEPYTVGKVRELLSGILESHQMPCHLIYIDEIPKTVSGKVRRSELKAGLPA